MKIKGTLLTVLALQFALVAAPMKGKLVTLSGGDDAQMVGGPAKKLIFLDFYNESNDTNLQYLSNSIGDAVDAAIMVIDGGISGSITALIATSAAP